MILTSQQRSPSPPDPSEVDIERALGLCEKTTKAHTDLVLNTKPQVNEEMVKRVGKTETDEERRTRMKNREDPAWIHENGVEATFSAVLAV